MNNISQKEYIADQEKLSGNKPPCIVCHRRSYEHCRDNEMDCKAFRIYANHDSYKDSDVGELKRSFNTEEDRFYV